LRAERRAGELIEATDIGPRRKSATLTDFGIDSQQSSRWQRVATLVLIVFSIIVRHPIGQVFQRLVSPRQPRAQKPCVGGELGGLRAGASRSNRGDPAWGQLAGALRLQRGPALPELG